MKKISKTIALIGLLAAMITPIGSCQDSVSIKEGNETKSECDVSENRLSECIVNFKIINDKGEISYHPAIGSCFLDDEIAEPISISMLDDTKAGPIGCFLTVTSLKKTANQVQISVSGKITDEKDTTVITIDKLVCPLNKQVETKTMTEKGKPSYLMQIIVLENKERKH